VSLLLLNARDVLRALAPIVAELKTAHREEGGYEPRRLADEAHLVELAMVRMPDPKDQLVEDKLYDVFETIGHFVGRSLYHDSRGLSCVEPGGDAQALTQAYDALHKLFPTALDAVVHRPFQALRPSVLAG
jgi:hypothetical protein